MVAERSFGHLDRGIHIGEGVVRPLQLLATVEEERSLWGPWLAPVKDRLCVEHHASFERELACSPAELRQQQREVEAGDIEPGEVAVVPAPR